jgi:hypothetical protein
MNEFYFERWQQMLFLQIIEQKKQGGNNLCWFLSKTIPRMKYSSHISKSYLIWNIFKLCNIQTI